MILKKVLRWSLVAIFWLFLVGWGISAFAAEWTAAELFTGADENAAGTCNRGDGFFRPNTANYATCVSDAIALWTNSTVPNVAVVNPVHTKYDATRTVIRATVTLKQSNGYQYPSVTLEFITKTISIHRCPPPGKPQFTVGPKALNGQQVCEKPPVSCKIGEQLFMDSTTGAETCKPNCSSVTGTVLDQVAYNQAFLPSANVTCYGLCSVVSAGGVTVGTSGGFEQFGNIQFTGENCPVTFPEEGEGQPINNNPPTSSEETNNAQNQLQNAASSATGNPVSGASGTADLSDVVDKLAETSNAEVKAMSEQNAALGKVIEGVGKDIQGAIREGNSSGGGASNGQLQTANAIKEGNQTLQEISDKLDEQQEEPEAPVAPGTSFDADATSVHEANDWGSRNFGTVLQANADRFRALPLFTVPSTFFTADFGGTGCPSYTGSFALLGATTNFEFSAFCSSAILDVMPYIRAVVIMFFGFLAWRIAVGNGG
ncbi:hypothetical protein [Aeromonas salmonicida]